MPKIKVYLDLASSELSGLEVNTDLPAELHKTVQFLMLKLYLSNRLKIKTATSGKLKVCTYIYRTTNIEEEEVAADKFRVETNLKYALDTFPETSGILDSATPNVIIERLILLHFLYGKTCPEGLVVSIVLAMQPAINDLTDRAHISTLISALNKLYPSKTTRPEKISKILRELSKKMLAPPDDALKFSKPKDKKDTEEITHPSSYFFITYSNGLISSITFTDSAIPKKFSVEFGEEDNPSNPIVYKDTDGLIHTLTQARNKTWCDKVSLPFINIYKNFPEDPKEGVFFTFERKDQNIRMRILGVVNVNQEITIYYQDVDEKGVGKTKQLLLDIGKDYAFLEELPEYTVKKSKMGTKKAG